MSRYLVVVEPDVPAAADAKFVDAARRDAVWFANEPCKSLGDEVTPGNRVFHPFRALQRHKIDIGVGAIRVGDCDGRPAVRAIPFHVEGDALVLVPYIKFFIRKRELMGCSSIGQIGDGQRLCAIWPFCRSNRHLVHRLPRCRRAEVVYRYRVQR